MHEKQATDPRPTDKCGLRLYVEGRTVDATRSPIAVRSLRRVHARAIIFCPETVYGVARALTLSLH